jgi:hypothetical protein
LDETNGASNLLALKDTEWYLLMQGSSRRTRDAAVSGLPSFRPAPKSRGEIAVLKAPKVVGQFQKTTCEVKS